MLAGAILLLGASRVQASELLYWNNYEAIPPSVAFANVDGSGGGSLNLSGVALREPEGMAIDTVTGRLYVVSRGPGPGGPGQILFANLDGSGAGVFIAPGALVDRALGVVVDPVARTIYWANNGDGVGDGSIAWAKLDGSAGGLLNTAGAELVDPYKIALDPVNGRVYWSNNPQGGAISISYANVNNSGGGKLPLSVAPESLYALAADPTAGRLYWSEGGQDRFAYAGLLGGAVNTLDTAGALLDSSYGFAVDPSAGRIYWANAGNLLNRVNGLGFAGLNGGGGNITPAIVPFDAPQDVVVLKSPIGKEPPEVAQDTGTRSILRCSIGGWAADFAGGYVYQAPTSYAYQWIRDGKPIPGATASTLTASSAGKHACVVTAANAAGSAIQASAAVKLAPSRLKLAVRPKVLRAKAGAVVPLKVQALNQGDAQASKAKLCVRVPGNARKDLRAPKCASLGRLNEGASKRAKLKVKVGADAAGTFKLRIVPKGVAGKAATAMLRVAG